MYNQNNMKTSPKDFFLHLGVIATLYAMAVAFINLAWRVIDHLFPREDFYYGFYESSLSGPVATLIVVFPIFIILSWLLNREYKNTPEKRNSWIRKWLVYITLFVAGIVIVVDLIIVLIAFLGGEIITLGFILKALSVLFVALAVFGYYISDLRDKTTPKRNKVFAWISGLIILALIVAGFSIMGSPRTQRLLRIDQNKVNDLQNIQWQIVNFWQQKGELPEALANLSDPISGFVVPKDPQSGEEYEYRILNKPLSFELCAEFNLSSRKNGVNTIAMRPLMPEAIGVKEDVWTHEAGRYCFERTIDPELYSIRKTPL